MAKHDGYDAPVTLVFICDGKRGQQAFFRQNDEIIKTLTLNLNVFKLGWAGDGKPRLYFIL